MRFPTIARLLVATTITLACAARPAGAAGPRIVNVYNFIRNEDWRVANAQDVMFDCVRRQVELFARHGLPVTWALQYDALVNPRYQALLKAHAGPKDEIAGWWELPRGLVEKAGLKWRGQHDWDSASDVGFSPGYTPDERRKLVDVYMADFKAIFGRYPLTVGSWYIDEVTLAYMAERYGVIASCNCKDQIGTDGYTLWGGYWNQAYYPSRLNAYMPAQTRGGQIDVPVFRMLGSDPIYQYGNPGYIASLEPVYGKAGGSPAWVDWFLRSLAQQPCLAFAYAQAGQENSFCWGPMARGLTDQAEKLERLSKAGTVRVETLAESGRWFREHHPLTPATAFAAMDDWRDQGRKTVWYNSRFYRLNLLWDADGVRIRDLHAFDEGVASPTHDRPLREHALAYGTLPIVDEATWGKGGGLPVSLAGGAPRRLMPAGPPALRESGESELSVDQPLVGGGRLTIACAERTLTLSAVAADGQPMLWALDLAGGARQASAVRSVGDGAIRYRAGQTDYALTVGDGGTCRSISDSTIRLTPSANGTLTLRVR